MRAVLLKIFFLLLLLNPIHTISALAEDVKDSLSISILTCGPGEEVYELYGHTAIRVQNISKGEDWVFNYGVFSFNKPNFVWNFMLGKTDYELGIVPYYDFIDSYTSESRTINELLLNLNDKEKISIYRSLLDDYRNKRGEYRYNFLYSNCTTRAIGQIENHIEGQINYMTDSLRTDLTYRKIIYEFLGNREWLKFGQDLILGRSADTPIGIEQQMFSPIYAQKYLEHATIMGTDGILRPLVVASNNIIPEDTDNDINIDVPISPMQLMLILLFIALGLSVYELKSGRFFTLFDIFLMLIHGFIGIFISILFFLSEQPTVNSNFLVTLYNPMLLAAIPILLFRKKIKIWRVCYVSLVLVTLALFLLTLLGNQCYPVEIYVWILILLMRVLVCLLHNNRIKKLHRV